MRRRRAWLLHGASLGSRLLLLLYRTWGLRGPELRTWLLDGAWLFNRTRLLNRRCLRHGPWLRRRA